MESAIRHTKSKLIGQQTAIEGCSEEKTKQSLQQAYDETSEKLSAQNRAYNEFCESNGLKRYADRLRSAKWNRLEAARAAQNARKIADFKDKIKSAGNTSTGITINDVATHIYTRSNFRGSSAEDIIDALTNPLKLGKIRTDMSQQFIGERATVAINTETGKVITCWPTGSKKAAKLKGGSTS